ncbi:MBL fold metallo-hydrolase [Allokutzneria oryzae]|uniref:MBL fold metallo-hydrolase n=1 Tax=Allokutzneria oryzae TaxID=1378989 RepID=A0ABV5ZWA7_9PSEU
MELIEVVPGLHMAHLEFGQSYVWLDEESVTLIDTGIAGSGAALAEAVRALGRDTASVEHVVLTHFHNDHAGAAAEINSWPNARVHAHHADVPMITGAVEGPPPVLTADWERELYDQITPNLPPAPPARVDVVLHGGEVLPFGGGAHILHLPGHTDGSIAIHLPEHGVLFTGDTISNVGEVALGVFNLDRDQAARSFDHMVGLNPRTVCFGHGTPLSTPFAGLWTDVSAPKGP